MGSEYLLGMVNKCFFFLSDLSEMLHCKLKKDMVDEGWSMKLEVNCVDPFNETPLKNLTGIFFFPFSIKKTKIVNQGSFITHQCV